jgi:hypothetical protein
MRKRRRIEGGEGLWWTQSIGVVQLLLCRALPQQWHALMVLVVSQGMTYRATLVNNGFVEERPAFRCNDDDERRTYSQMANRKAHSTGGNAVKISPDAASTRRGRYMRSKETYQEPCIAVNSPVCPVTPCGSVFQVRPLHSRLHAGKGYPEQRTPADRIFLYLAANARCNAAQDQESTRLGGVRYGGLVLQSFPLSFYSTTSPLPAPWPQTLPSTLHSLEVGPTLPLGQCPKDSVSKHTLAGHLGMRATRRLVHEANER